MRIDEFIQHLDGVKPDSNGYIARCPAHDDTTPSLSISTGDGGRILLKCHTGCSTGAVLAAVSLEMKDLFYSGTSSPTPPDKPKPAAYPIGAEFYQSANDALLADSDQLDYLLSQRGISKETVRRYTIGLRHKHGQRQITLPVLDQQGICRDMRLWLAPDQRKERGPKILHYEDGYGAARLYPIDQLQHERLVVCEGEMDALALLSAGIPAITVTGGATTWPDDLSASFIGKHVTLLMDNDKAGRDGASKRANSLQKHGATVRVATWPQDRPEGHDATDELLRPDGQESLQRILSAAQEPVAPEDAPCIADDAEWAELAPLSDTVTAPPPFDMEMLPDAMRAWVADIAYRMQCPPDFVAVSAMVAASAVVGRQMTIRPKQHDDWTVVPNLWGAIVSSSGSMKSPAMDAGLTYIRQLEAQAIQRADGQGGHRRYIVNDATPEKLVEILKDNPIGVLQYRDELRGFFEMLGKSVQEGARQMYLEFWNGTQAFTTDRIARGTTRVDAACISLLGSIQPGPLSTYLQGAAKKATENDGLFQRVQLLVYPETATTYQDVDQAPDTEAAQRVSDVFARLNNLQPSMQIDSSSSEPTCVRFAPDAQERFRQWHSELESRLRANTVEPALQTHLNKYRSLVPSLALLTHLIDDGVSPVSPAALDKALRWATYLEGHLVRIYAESERPAKDSLDIMLENIKHGRIKDGMTAFEISRNNRHSLGNTTAVEACLEQLVTSGMTKVVEVSTGGRPAKRYVFNPRIRELRI